MPWGWSCLWCWISQVVCCVWSSCIILNTEGYLLVMNKYSHMSWCCVLPCLLCHIFYSAARWCIFPEWLWTASSRCVLLLAGQTCCSVQIGDSFSFYTVMQLSPAGSLYHKYLTVSFAFDLLFLSTVVLQSICLSSDQSPSSTHSEYPSHPVVFISLLLFVFSYYSLSLFGATMSV